MERCVTVLESYHALPCWNHTMRHRVGIIPCVTVLESYHALPCWNHTMRRRFGIIPCVIAIIRSTAEIIPCVNAGMHLALFRIILDPRELNELLSEAWRMAIIRFGAAGIK